MNYLELSNINLQGWECYQRESTVKGFLYSFQKKEGDLWLSMVSLFDNITFQIEHSLTDVNKYNFINEDNLGLKPIILN